MVISMEDLLKRLPDLPRPIVATSGGFDPLHVGHLRCILEAKKLGGTLVVIVNGDGFLMRKKRYQFMPCEDRMEIIDGIRGVDYVVDWDDGSQFVSKAIELIKPNIFAKGGDRAEPKDIPEWDICQQVGCQVVFGVGGGKIRSSSELVEQAREAEPKLS
ncbi:MAG: adenylyltransferase/cytidyltransferase family protein [Patescibacteria group bacterium]|nr:adenylyltransferase/cytidyltransferase family protein [Patescibacteria group bacterium]